MGKKKNDLVVPMFPIEQISPAEAELRAMKERKRLDSAARREAAKAKRERTEADDARKTDDFNKRVGTTE